jgi:hypothetical protein
VAVEEGWQRRYPPRKLNLDAIQDLLGTAAMEAELLGGGLRNTNYRLHLAGDPRPVVLRLYTADTAACAVRCRSWGWSANARRCRAL